MFIYIILIGITIIITGIVLKFAFKMAGCILKGALISGLIIIVVGLIILLASSGA